MSDGGSDQDLDSWVSREIFSVGSRMEVESESDQGRVVVARFTNST